MNSMFFKELIANLARYLCHENRTAQNVKIMLSVKNDTLLEIPN